MSSTKSYFVFCDCIFGHKTTSRLVCSLSSPHLVCRSRTHPLVNTERHSCSYSGRSSWLHGFLVGRGLNSWGPVTVNRSNILSEQNSSRILRRIISNNCMENTSEVGSPWNLVHKYTLPSHCGSQLHSDTGKPADRTLQKSLGCTSHYSRGLTNRADRCTLLTLGGSWWERGANLW